MTDPALEITAKVATELVKDGLHSLYEPISDLITVKRTQYLEKFSRYCEGVLIKCGMVRTLYQKNKPVPLESVYVKTHFTQGNTRFSDKDLINKFSAGYRLVVKGNGGSGKTIFLKYLWLSRFKVSEGKIPIFVELRRVNDLSTLDLMTFCRSEIQADASFGKGVFEKLCEAGKFEFIFDGFDEVSREKRKAVEKQILDISHRYRKCNFLVSGRDDDRFSSWGEFQIFSVAPLNLDELKELIEKVTFCLTSAPMGQFRVI